MFIEGLILHSLKYERHIGLRYEYGLKWFSDHPTCSSGKCKTTRHSIMYMDINGTPHCYNCIRSLEENNIEYALGLKQKIEEEYK